MKELINIIDKKLDEYLQITYPEDIFKAMKYTLMLPGKRLRPVMCIETARLLGCDIEKVYNDKFKEIYHRSEISIDVFSFYNGYIYVFINFMHHTNLLSLK